MADSAGPGKKSAPKRQPPTHPKWYDMVLEAVGDTTDSKGASVQAIKAYIAGKYPTVDQSTMKHSIRRALDKGLELKVLKRPKSSEEATGLTGRFKLDKAAIKAETKAKAKPTKPKKVAASDEKTPPKAKKTAKTDKTDKAATAKTTKSKTVAKKQLNLGTPKATKPKPKKAEMKTPKKPKSALKSKSSAKKANTPIVKATKKKTTPKKSKVKTTKSKS